MQKILLPVVDDMLSEDFSKSQFYRIYHVSKHTVRREESVETGNLRSDKLAGWIMKKKITDLIVDKIERDVLDTINRAKINVFIGVKPEKTERIIEDMMKGVLETRNNSGT